MNRAAFIFLLLAFVWCPFSIFFDSPLAELLVCLLPLFSLLLLVLERWEDPEWIRIPPGFNVILFLIAFGVVQLIPLPSPLVRILSPNSWNIYQDTVGVFQEGSWMSLSLTPKATLGMLFRLIGCWAGYIAAANLFVEGNRLKLTASFMSAFGGGIAVVILGVWGIDAIFGTFSGNAGFQSVLSPRLTVPAGLILVTTCSLSLALFLAERPTVHYGTWKERLREYFFSFRQKRHFLYGLPAFLIPLALVPLWPGGLQVLLLILVLLLVMLGFRSRGRRIMTYLFGYLLLILILAVSTFIQNEFLPEEVADAPMVQVEENSGKAVSSELPSDFLVTGAGYGSFSSISQRYGLVSSSEKQGRVGQGFIRFVSQAGLIGLVATCWFLGTFVFHTFHRWWNRRQKLTVYLYPAGLGGILSFILGYFSFGGNGLEGIALPVSLLFGLTAASAKPLPQTRDDDFLQISKPATVFLTISSIFFIAFFNLGDLTGKNFYDQARNLVSETREAREYSRKLLIRASFFDPFNSRYRYAQGYHAMDSGKEELARGYFIEGLRLAPLDSKSLFGLGQYLFTSGDADSGQKLLHAALKSEPFSREIQSAYVDQMIKSGKGPEAWSLIKNFLQSSPQDTLFWIQNLANLGIDEAVRPRILPELSRSYHDYGLYLLQRGDAVKADRFFRKAVEIARKEKKPEKSIFLSLVGFFEKHQSFDKALETLLVAREKYPDETSFLMASGRVYEEMGITFKAKEIYQEVLILDPSNEDARQRMETLDMIF
jgi:tetratricopeptide (TPR) repeat protein